MCSCKMGAGAGQNALEITLSWVARHDGKGREAPSLSPSLVRSCIPSLTSLNPGSSSRAVCLTTLLYCRTAERYPARDVSRPLAVLS